jgi:hypothetical protein
MEIEIAFFVDSVAAMNMSKYEVDEHVDMIRKKYKTK